ncbi:MAG TPA: 2-C-methyl-D-erythritol 4-phosphate cytidylyltransferase, partial [Sphingobacteriaceae bacterium]
MKYYAIVVAGGTGNRMQNDVPKQFLLLDGKPVLMHSIEAFFNSEYHPSIIVVLNPEYQEQWKTLCNQYDFKIRHQICEGGQTRYHSVKNALNFISKDSITAIHDGARPLVTTLLIDKCYGVAEKNGNAIAALKSSDSIRQIKGNSSIALNREEIYRVQTPQTFRSDHLLIAYKQPYNDAFSDDATVL